MCLPEEEMTSVQTRARAARLVRRRGCSGALEVFERCGQAERLVQDKRAAVHALDHVPAA